MKKLLSLMCSLLIIVTLCGCSSTQDQQEEVTLTLVAAASLENVFEDKLIPEFEKENPSIKVQGVYDSSGKLQIQIEQGLKADVFFSAATVFPNPTNTSIVSINPNVFKIFLFIFFPLKFCIKKSSPVRLL